MFRNALFVAVVVAAVAVGYGAAQPSAIDTPIPFTPRLLAEIVCVTKSDGVVTFSYDAEQDVVLAVMNPVIASAKNAADVRQRTVSNRATPVLSFIQKHVSPNARLAMR